MKDLIALFISTFLIVCLTTLVVSGIEAAEYTYYFATAGTDTPGAGGCDDSGDPCSTLAHAKTLLGSASGSSDTVNLLFNRGDTWEEDSDEVGVKTDYGLIIESTDPITQISWYGTGDKPKFSGQVTDFSGVPNHDASNGPSGASRFFEFERDDCSISNVEISGVYGNAILLDNANNFTVDSCDIFMFGAAALTHDVNDGTNNNTVKNSLIHTGQQLYLESKRSFWASAIDFALSKTGSPKSYDNTIQYNVIYNIAGEGVINPNGTTEYNVFGDTSSAAIDTAAFGFDYDATIIRYNKLIHSDWATSDYDNKSPAGVCFRVFDERDGGDNSVGSLDIYGNICVNYEYGLRMSCSDAGSDECGNPIGNMRIYNNIFVDNESYNIWSTDFDDVGTAVSFYNNSSILYDRPGSVHIYDGGEAPSSSSWERAYNHFWTTGGSPTVDSDWRTDYKTGDPKLAGEPAVDWDGQSEATYYQDITVANLYPATDSDLVDNGVDLDSDIYETDFLTTGDTFVGLPSGGTFILVSQSDDYKDIGAVIRTPVTYNYYFSDDATGNSAGDDANYSNDGDLTNDCGNDDAGVSACKTLSVADTLINNASVDDTVNIYFDKSDTWSFDSAAVVGTEVYGLFITSGDPIVNIGAYGTGAKPKFYGGIVGYEEEGTDFSEVPVHNVSTGPVKWNTVFKVHRDGCTFDNLHIDGVYGHGIFTGVGNTHKADNLTISNCDFTNFGNSAFRPSTKNGTQNTTITNNLIHTGQQLWRFSKQTSFGFAISFAPWTGALRTASGNLASYNLIYDIMGEGIHGVGYTAEYNLIGDTWSYGIFVCPDQQDGEGDTIIRYNKIIQSSSNTYKTGKSGSTYAGIVVAAEDGSVGGDNRDTDIEIYGNTVINRDYGIRLANFDDNVNTEFNSIKIYNNTVIDSNTYNMFIHEEPYLVKVGGGEIYNNAFLSFDNSPENTTDQDDHVDGEYWDIDNNAFWENGIPTVDPQWDTNAVTGDPKLPGSGWTTQSGAGYYDGITVDDDLYPPSDSSLVDSAKTLGPPTYVRDFLTTGDDFTTLPDSEDFTLALQAGVYDIGAVIRGGTIVEISCASSIAKDLTGDCTISCTEVELGACTGLPVPYTYSGATEDVGGGGDFTDASETSPIEIVNKDTDYTITITNTNATAGNLILTVALTAQAGYTVGNSANISLYNDPPTPGSISTGGSGTITTGGSGSITLD